MKEGDNNGLQYSWLHKKLGENACKTDNKVRKDKISKAPFDKAFIGTVVDKETFTDYRGDTYISRWIVAAGGRTFRIDINSSDIKSIGQQVRVFVPSNHKNSAYAEVINPATAPDKIVYVENDSRYDKYKSYGVDTERQITVNDVTIDSITEKWGLADKTALERLYLLTVINAGNDNEEVTNIVCPDGKIINLEGFLING